MTTSIPLPLALGRFKQLPQRSNEIWQGGLVKLPAWVDNPQHAEGPPYRPTGALWVSLRTGLLHMAFPDQGEAATPALAVKALIEFGLKEAKRLSGRPSVIEIRDWRRCWPRRCLRSRHQCDWRSAPSAEWARLFEGRSFESLDDANAEVQHAEADGVFEKDAAAAALRPLTPLEQAQELAYDAMEATGRLRTKLARRALALSTDCADACVVLGEESASPEEARDWYQRGVDAGARAIGADNFATLRGEFWGHLETRPYMRARLALAQALCELGQEKEALDHYRELLQLNPNDNQGVRYLLLPALLEHRQDADAERLLGEYDGDIQAMWPYARALRAFQLEGDGNRARAALKRAIGVNPFVVRYLLDPDAIPPDAPPHVALGSREEAAYVAEGLHTAFDVTPGALSWLQASGGRLDGPSKQRKGRSRSH